MANYFDLREANVARDIEWTGGRPVSFTFRAAELAGEIGEVVACFVRPDDAPFDVTEFLTELRDELADGFITVDLIGMKLGFPSIPVDEEIARPEMLDSFRPKQNVELFGLLGREVGAICNGLKKLEREAEGWVGSRYNVTDAWAPLFRVHCILRTLCERYSIDPRVVTSAKFNATSEKYGLVTRLY
jgi:hypothetical protein